MKVVRIIVILLMGINCAQGQSYKEGFRSDMCDCLTEESLKRKLTENAFKACLRETLPKYATQIDAEIIEEDIDKKYLKGQLARRDLLVAMQSELIYSCEVYYNHLDYDRTSIKLITRENAKESELERYNQMVALSPNAMAYFMRAQLQFNLGNIKEAEADIKKSMELNPNNENIPAMRRELLLLAWVYEEQERYSEAVAIYDKIYLGALDAEVAKLRALADKKNGGTIANIPKLDEGKIESQTKQVNQNSRRSKQSNTKTTVNKSNSQKDSKNTKKKDTASLRKLFRIKDN